MTAYHIDLRMGPEDSLLGSCCLLAYRPSNLTVPVVPKVVGQQQHERPTPP